LISVFHIVVGDNETLFNSSIEFLEETGPREAFKSNRFMDLLLDFSTDMTTRAASARLNRIRLEDTGISPQTLRNAVEREGFKIQRHMEEQSIAILEENGITINEAGQMQKDAAFDINNSDHIPEEDVQAAADRLEIKYFDASDYESPDSAVNISVDDVGVKRQTECRPRQNNPEEQPKRVNNTVIHVQEGDGSFIINSGNVIGAFIQLVSFLIHNGLLGKQLVFFVDGARNLNNAIANLFHMLNFKVILDWHHLNKKCREQLSLALKGRKIRNDLLDELIPVLWCGNVDKGIELLRSINPGMIKNQKVIDQLIGYFERLRDCIPCYALRKELGLRNSSNRVEKANDTIVAKRQKRNGMSWSDCGSIAFASVTAVKCNGQLDNWVRTRSIHLSFERNLMDDAA